MYVQYVLPKGYRFCPSDDELVNYFLYNKVAGQESAFPDFPPIPVVDIYSQEPWEVWKNYERQVRLGSGEECLYFFAIAKKLTPNGNRFKRKIEHGSGTWSEGEVSKTVSDESGNPIGIKRKFRYEDKGSDQHGAWQIEQYNSSFSPDWVIGRLKKNKLRASNKENADNMIKKTGQEASSSSIPKEMNDKRKSRKLKLHPVEKVDDVPQNSIAPAATNAPAGNNDQIFNMFAMPINNAVAVDPPQSSIPTNDVPDYNGLRFNTSGNWDCVMPNNKVQEVHPDYYNGQELINMGGNSDFVMPINNVEPVDDPDLDALLNSIIVEYDDDDVNCGDGGINLLIP